MARLTNGSYKLTSELSGGESITLSNISIYSSDATLHELGTCLGQFKDRTVEHIIITDNYEILAQ